MNALGSQLEMLAWPCIDLSARGVDLLNNDMAMRFAVRDHPLLTSEEIPLHEIIEQRPIIEKSILSSLRRHSSSVQPPTHFPGPDDMRRFVGEAFSVKYQTQIGRGVKRDPSHLKPTRLPKPVINRSPQTTPQQQQLQQQQQQQLQRVQVA